MKKFLIILLAVLILLLVAAGYLFFQKNYIIVDGSIHSRDVAELDLSGTILSSPEKLAELKNLSRLNLQDTGITEAQYKLLTEKLPGCDISWSVPFQGAYYPNDSEILCISTLTEADIAQLSYFPKLIQVDASACTDLASVQALQNACPELAVSYQVPLDGKLLSQDTTALTLGNGTVEALAEALAYLPNVSQVDASGCRDYEALQALQTQYPACNIRYLVSVAGQELENTAETLTVKDPDLSQLETALPYLPDLQTVQLTGKLPANEGIHALQKAYPHVRFLWSFLLCGVEVSTADTEIDLSNIAMENTVDVENALPYFNDLEKVIMCDCGISNVDMDLLGQRHPDVRFVWTVSIGPHIRLRTDATYLMPYQYGTKLTDSQTGNLKYCIDLICIDLGHNPVSDVSFLAYMPHMKYLLLAQTDVSDISMCAGMEELEYAELFMTKIKDYSPLLSCPNLRDLNISYALPKDVSVLCQLTQLDNLYMKGYWNTGGEARLQQALPNTNLVFGSAVDNSATGSGWRELPNYYKMRDLLGMEYMTG